MIQQEENDHRNYFMIIRDRTGIELATPGSAVRPATVARQVTDCAMRYGRGVKVSKVYLATSSVDSSYSH